MDGPWFQICFIFTPIWGIVQFWLIFFRWVETTNQWINRVYHASRCFPIPSTVGKKIITILRTAFDQPSWSTVNQCLGRTMAGPNISYEIYEQWKKIWVFKRYIGKLHYQLNYIYRDYSTNHISIPMYQPGFNGKHPSFFFVAHVESYPMMSYGSTGPTLGNWWLNGISFSWGKCWCPWDGTPSCSTPRIYRTYIILCKVYMGLITKGTIPTLPPFSLWVSQQGKHTPAGRDPECNLDFFFFAWIFVSWWCFCGF